MVKLLNWLIEKRMSLSKKPWARFIVSGILEDNQIRFEIAYNKAFIKNINNQGFFGIDDEEAIQNFLFGSMMLPKKVFDELEDEVNSNEHPNLSSDANILRR